MYKPVYIYFIGLFALHLNLLSMEEETVGSHKLTKEEKTRLSELPEELKWHIKKFIYAGTLKLTGKLDPKKMVQEITNGKYQNEEEIKSLINYISFLYPYPKSKMQIDILKSKAGTLGNTLFILAVDMKLEEIVELILNQMNNFNQDDQINIFRAINIKGFNALTVAVIERNRKIINLLLDYIKNFPEISQVYIINAKDLLEEKTVLYRAVEAGDEYTTEQILNHIENFNKKNKSKIIHAKNRDGLTPFVIAANLCPMISKQLEQALK